MSLEGIRNRLLTVLEEREASAATTDQSLWVNRYDLTRIRREVAAVRAVVDMPEPEVAEYGPAYRDGYRSALNDVIELLADGFAPVGTP